MKIKLIVLSAFCLIILAFSKDNSSLEKLITSYNPYFSAILVQHIKDSDSKVLAEYKMDINSLKYVIIPICSFDDNAWDKSQVASSLRIKVDTSRSFYIIDHSDSSYYLGNLYWHVGMKDRSFFGGYKDVWPDNISPLKFALSQSRCVFFLDFGILPITINSGFILEPIVGYTVNNQVKFIDSKMTIFDNFNQLICNKFGSEEKFLELINQKRETKLLISDKLKNIDDAIRIIKTSHYNWKIYNPIDTISRINSYIASIEATTILYPAQKSILFNQLLFLIRNGFEKDGYIVIDLAIQSILERDQYCNYVAKQSTYLKLVGEAESYVHQFLRNQIEKTDSIGPSNKLMLENNMFKDIFK